MKKRVIYIISVCAVLLLTLTLSNFSPASGKRIWQHRESSGVSADTSVDITAENFSSHLPVISIDTGGAEIPGRPVHYQSVSKVSDSTISAKIKIFDEQEKLNSLSSPVSLESSAEIRIRGNSSRKFDKPGYLLKLCDSSGNPKACEIMGMEKESTWILNGPFLDKTLMRNYMWYNLSGEIMDWAPDVRLCELFLNGEYQGVYVMTEQIGESEGRINISGYREGMSSTGYIICADRAGVNGEKYADTFTAYTGKTDSMIEIKYPGKAKLTDQLVKYISEDFSQFEKVLYSYDYSSPTYGYRKYIDVDSFVNYFIINEVSQNSDAGIFSTFFYKDLNGKIKMCVWDFNNCCDNRLDEQQPMTGFFLTERPWFEMLCRDEYFVKCVIERYRQLRKTCLSDEAVRADIDDIRDYLGTAVERNFSVWGYTFEPEYDLTARDGRPVASYEDAIEQYQKRLIGRMRWLDRNIESLYMYCHESVNKSYNCE
ncbi:MAG: CotH kinase family protein [Porcipelethomonas sp.]